MPSVAIKSTDPKRIERAVRAHVSELRKRHPDIEQVLWFGSWVNGSPTPGSDVDLCVVVRHSDCSPRDRIPEYLPFGFPVGVDVFVYTREEFARLRETSPRWYAAITSGLEM